MTILIDSSYLYAIYNSGDVNSKKALPFAVHNTEDILVPVVILPEVSFLFERDLGYRGVNRFLQTFAIAGAPLISIILDDLKRAAEISTVYHSAEFDLVDCCVMALAERMNITKVCTFDRTDFSIFRPKHTEYLELLP